MRGRPGTPRPTIPSAVTGSTRGPRPLVGACGGGVEPLPSRKGEWGRLRDDDGARSASPPGSPSTTADMWVPSSLPARARPCQSTGKAPSYCPAL